MIDNDYKLDRYCDEIGTEIAHEIANDGGDENDLQERVWEYVDGCENVIYYHRAKVIVGVTKACEKRPVSLEEIEIIVDRVEQKLAGAGRREVPSEAIGRYVMEELRDVDEVAYVRFASVYRSFQNVEEFFSLLKDLREGDGDQ